MSKSFRLLLPTLRNIRWSSALRPIATRLEFASSMISDARPHIPIGLKAELQRMLHALILLLCVAFSTTAFAGLPQSIPVANIVVKTPDAAPFTLPAVASSGLTITWESLTGPATVAGNTVTLTGGSGAVTLRGRQPGNATYDPSPDNYETFVVEIGGGFLKMAAGEAHVLGIRADGQIWSWGRNYQGQLGDGTTDDRATPQKITIPGTALWSNIACGSGHSLALRADGTLWAWGANTNGQLGIGNTLDKSFPTQVGTLNTWAGVSCGANHTLAWRTDGTLYAWGSNSQGQLGDGTIGDRTAPVKIGTAQDWVEISCGAAHTVGRRAGGSLWAWGGNVSGQLGDNTTTRRLAPTRIGTASNWAGVGAGYSFSLGRRSDGTLWTWGNNDSGQLGNDTRVQSNVPQQVGTDTDWAAASCGASCVIARKNDTWMWAWGDNSAGQLGDLTTLDRLLPVRTMLGPWNSVAVGAACVLAVRNESLWTWGTNDNEQLALPPEITGAAAVPPAPRLPLRSAQTVATLPNSVRQSVPLAASSSSFLPAVLSIISGPATLSPNGTSLIFTGEGPVVVEVAQPGDGSWDPAPTRTFTIQADGTGPVFTTAPATRTVQLAGVNGTVVTFDAVALDAVSGSANVVCVPPSGSLFPGGITQVTCTATDAVGNPTVHQFDINVNRRPVAQGFTSSAQPPSLFIPLSAADVDNDPLTYRVVTPPASGTLSGVPPLLIYTPSAGFVGSVQLTFVANDGTIDSLPATVTMNVQNALPVVPSSSLLNAIGATSAINLTGTDANQQVLTFSIVSGPSHGSLSGTIPNLVYTPTPGFAGPDTIVYKANDGLADSLPATITILVGNNPAVTPLNITTNEDTPQAITLAGSSPNGFAISFSIVTPPAHGTLSGLRPNITYTPAANYNGPDSFTYRASDGFLISDPGTVTINVLPQNDAPTVVAQTVSTNEDTPKVITLTGNDIDGDALTFTVTSPPTNGTVSGAPPNVTYTPSMNFHGTDAFSFAASDGTASSAPSTISITINSVNDAPETNFDLLSVNEDESLAVAYAKRILKNDSDLNEGGPGENNNPLTASLVSAPAHASAFSLNSDGTFTYSPRPNFHGIDGFTYRAVDSLGAQSEPETVVIVVWAVNDAPVATPLAKTTLEDVPVTIQLRSADQDLVGGFDPNNSYGIVPPNNGPAPHDADPTYTIVTPPAHGTISGTLPNVIYTPAANYNGPDSFTYTANDGLAASAPATVTLTIQADSDADLLPDAWEMQAFASLAFDGTSDPDGDGQNNNFELIVGNDPNDSKSSLRIDIVSIKPNDGTLWINRVQPGVVYFLESSQDLLHWDTISQSTYEITAPGSIADPRTDAPSERFYRIRVDKAP